jgi:hypothetical protein
VGKQQHNTHQRSYLLRGLCFGTEVFRVNCRERRFEGYRAKLVALRMWKQNAVIT